MLKTLGRMIVIGWVCSATASASPQEGNDGAPAPDPSGHAEFVALKEEFQAASRKFFKAYYAIESDAEQQKFFESSYPKPEHYAPRFKKIAEAHRHQVGALEALTWIIKRSMGPIDSWAAQRILKDHAEASVIPELCSSFGKNLDAVAETFLTQVMQLPRTKCRALGTFYLAQSLKKRADLARRLPRLDEDTLLHMKKRYGAATLAAVRNEHPADLLKRTERLLEQVADNPDWAGFKHVFRGTIGAAARGDLFEIRNLAMGKTAPEIEGKDVDGVTFKLSDYRGKVVLLDFWGDW